MLKNLRSKEVLRCCRISDFYRTLLSDAYKCDQLWKERLKSPYLQKIDPKMFGIQLLDSFNKTKTLHSVDVDLLVNKIQDLPAEYIYLVKEVLYRFRHCNTSIPIQDKIMHAVVRGHMDKNELENLMEMLKDKSKYGVFPDDHSMCMLLDHFINKKNFKDAAQLAYDVMLQEEYDNQTVNLLAVYAAVKHFCNTFDMERPEAQPKQDDQDEDIEYIAVKVIRNPYYDDHFDIKDERFLLGKTLYNLGSNTPVIDGALSRSLQLIGLGLYEKFELANQFLEKWISNRELPHVVCCEALNYYKEFLSSAPTRDPEAEPVSLGLKTIDHEIELMKLTPDGKSNCIKKLESLTSDVKENRLPSLNIEEKIETYVSGRQFEKYQKEDIKALMEKYKQWMEDRDKSVSEFLTEKKRHEIENEIQEKLAAIQEREELLTYFDNQVEIKELAKRHPRTVRKKDIDEEYVDAPGERGGKKSAIK